MNYLDYFILAIVFIGFILGYKDGIIRKIIGLAGLILAIYLAVTYADLFGKYLSPMFNNESYLAKIVAGIIIFLATILIISIIKRIIHPADKVNKFVNQFLGGIAGIIQLVFLTSVLLLLLNLLSFPDEKDKEESLLYSSVYSIMPSTIDLIVGSDFKTVGFIKDYIESQSNKEVPEEFSAPIDLDTLK